jgi:hypothetical protein
VKIGVLLPTFRDNAIDALSAARRCEELSLDGVFAYDHLWPMGSPSRPSLAPFAVLAAVAQRSPTLYVGPLVARVGMVGTSHLVNQFRTLAALAPGRVIAAVGTGDTKSRDELEGYGLVLAIAEERRAVVEEVVVALKDDMTVWVGAGAGATNDVARRWGVALNLWDKVLDDVTTHVTAGPVTWAGPPREDLAGWLDALERVGVGWAVFAPNVDVDELANWRHGH